MVERCRAPVADAPLQERLDYTLDPQGRWVFTARHLHARGYCCFQACRNCPWGQAGRTSAEAFADLRRRLDVLEERLRSSGMEVEATGYRLGVLHVWPARSRCATDLPGLDRLVREQSSDLLTVVDVAWK